MKGFGKLWKLYGSSGWVEEYSLRKEEKFFKHRSINFLVFYQIPPSNITLRTLIPWTRPCCRSRVQAWNHMSVDGALKLKERVTPNKRIVVQFARDARPNFAESGWPIANPADQSPISDRSRFRQTTTPVIHIFLPHIFRFTSGPMSLLCVPRRGSRSR